MRRFLFLAALWLPTLVAAQPHQQANAAWDGNLLSSMCEAVERAPSGDRALLCYAYLTGFVDAYTLVAAMGGLNHCLPSPLQVGQVARIVNKYAREHPEELHLRARLLTANALHTAFPCPHLFRDPLGILGDKKP